MVHKYPISIQKNKPKVLIKLVRQYANDFHKSGYIIIIIIIINFFKHPRVTLFYTLPSKITKKKILD
jgi:hypothetical protein